MEINSMEQYIPLERAQIVDLYIEKNYSIVKAHREFRAKSESRSTPSKKKLI